MYFEGNHGSFITIDQPFFRFSLFSFFFQNGHPWKIKSSKKKRKTTTRERLILRKSTKDKNRAWPFSPRGFSFFSLLLNYVFLFRLRKHNLFDLFSFHFSPFFSTEKKRSFSIELLVWPRRRDLKNSRKPHVFFPPPFFFVVSTGSARFKICFLPPFPSYFSSFFKIFIWD